MGETPHCERSHCMPGDRPENRPDAPHTMNQKSRNLHLQLPAKPVIGASVTLYDLVDSTNDLALQQLEQGAPGGLVVVADRQTAGRGRFSREWISAPGEDVMMTVGLRPPSDLVERLSPMAGLAMALTVDEIAGVGSTIKWPNDVRVDGLKIAGVLIETRVIGDETLAVIGIGVNLVLDPSQWPEIAKTATSVFAVSGRRVKRDSALAVLVRRLDELYRRLLARDSLTAEWADRLDTIGNRVELTPAPGGEPIKGMAIDVTDGGALVVQLDDGTERVFNAGEVTSQKPAQSPPQTLTGGTK